MVVPYQFKAKALAQHGCYGIINRILKHTPREGRGMVLLWHKSPKTRGNAVEE